MKLLAHFTPDKFSAFPRAKQLNSIEKLSLALEQNLADQEQRKRLITHILELCTLIEKPLPAKLQLFIKELHPELSPHQVLNKLYFFHDAALRKDSQLFIRQGDGSVSPDPELRVRAKQITIICDNLRSVFNVGSLFRSAECLGIGQILLCGISPTPQHSNMAKTAMGTQDVTPCQYFNTTMEAMTHCCNLGYSIYALETVSAAKSVFETRFELPLAILLGNESLGIDPSLLKLCDHYICLPQLGWKNSLNVGVAAAVTLYQIVFGGK